jgi:hypothetical protein
MTQIDELLRQTANAVERDDEAERRAIGRAQLALSAAIAAAAAQDLPQPQAKRHGWGMWLPRRALAMLARVPRLALASGLASLAAAVAVVVVFATAGTPPAYALTQNSNGTYSITINDVTTGVPALNAKLKQLGIDAVAVPVTNTCTAPPSSLTERIETQLSPALTTAGSGGLINLDQANIPAGTEGVIAAYQSPSGQVNLTFSTTTGSIPSCLNTSDVVPTTS